jgi:hypothetical protein
MLICSAIRMYAALLGALFLSASPALAQFSPRPMGSDPATGERYHIEAAAGFWSPTANMSISSESIGIPGSTINFKNDLGLTDQRFSEIHLVLRPATKHKFRFQYIPIKYEQRATITRDIVFNGQLYRVGLPVNSVLDWKAYRFGYEYDFISRDRGFGGFILDFKYTDVQASLASPVLSTPEFAHARAPIPTIGGIIRYYIVPNISITGELTGIKVPDSVSKEFKAHYADLDIYGTVNFTNNIGAQVGYRNFDLGYLVDDDTGTFELKGLYFGVVARY